MKRYLLTVTAFCLTGLALSAQDNDKETEAAAESKEQKPVIEKVGETEYKLGVIHFDKKTRAIWFPAVVNQDAVILEFAIVNSANGKLHESLLATDARPFDLQVVLKLLKYSASGRDLYPAYDEDGNVKGPMKVDELGKVAISVDYEEPVIGWPAMIEKETARLAAAEKVNEEVKDGAKLYEMKTRSVDIGEMIVNAQTEKVLGADAWVYTGSMVVDGQFMAEVEGAIAAVYRAPDTMMNAFAEGSDSDEVWYPRKGHVPPVDTLVTVKISPREK